MKRIRKPISIILVLIIALSVHTSALAADFSTLSDWANKEVRSLYARGVVDDALLQDFSQAITRAEFTSIIVNSYELITTQPISAVEPGFEDIESNRYKLSINKAYAIGAINGKSASQFDPDAYIKREESAKILYSIQNALGTASPLSNEELSYADSDSISAWAKPYVAYATKNGLMQGTSTGFDPAGTLTRQQAMVIIERLIAIYVPNEMSSAIKSTSVYRALGVGNYDFTGDKYDGDRFKVAVEEFEYAFNRLYTPGGGSYEVGTAYNIRENELYALIDSFYAGATEDDVSLFFISTHGVNKETDFGDRISTVPELVLSDGQENDFVSFEMLLNAFDRVPGTKVLIIGACYSGAILNYAIPDNTYILTASTGEQESFGFVIGATTYNEFEHEFAKAMGYQNRPSGEPRLYADLDKDGFVTFQELTEYITGAVELSQPLYYAPRDLVLALNPYNS